MCAPSWSGADTSAYAGPEPETRRAGQLGGSTRPIVEATPTQHPLDLPHACARRAVNALNTFGALALPPNRATELIAVRPDHDSALGAVHNRFHSAEPRPAFAELAPKTLEGNPTEHMPSNGFEASRKLDAPHRNTLWSQRALLYSRNHPFTSDHRPSEPSPRYPPRHTPH